VAAVDGFLCEAAEIAHRNLQFRRAILSAMPIVSLLKAIL